MANTESNNTVQIIPYYAQPHVHTVIIDNTWYDETVATPTDPNNLPYATCVVTGADSGIDNTFVRVNNLKTKNSIFGRGNFAKYGQPSIQADLLFNGKTNVWFCRVLPENATYSNVVILAHYRKGNILDEYNQETGLSRMEVKFSVVNAVKPKLVDGARNDFDIQEFARTFESKNADALSGYMTVPICYVRSIGRGQYGNNYSISMTRDTDCEKEYNLKMYRFNLLQNDTITRIINVFSGSLYQTMKYGMSTLISDVLGQFSTGSCPVKIYPFESNFEKLWDFYKNTIVAKNDAYLRLAPGSEKVMADHEYAMNMLESAFDPIFGARLNTRTGETIPYYRNYTTKASGQYIKPALVIPNVAGAAKPMNVHKWTTAFVGGKVLVVADPLHKGYRWLYTVLSIDPDSGNIVYDEGVEVAIDDDQYDGVDLSLQVGNSLSGGHDGDFQEITVNGTTRPPTGPEMKLLLAKEQVIAFRGQKDNKILSPSRLNMDFMFDANYNMTVEELYVDGVTIPLYGNSTVLTDEDAQQLAIIGKTGIVMDFKDLNVKRAMYDLNSFRNRNGNTMNLDQGAGCLLHLDCNLVGLKGIGVNYELIDIIHMMTEFTGRQTSIDLGSYEIFDPASGKRIRVTTSYFLAQNLINHIIKEKLNKPFVNIYAQLRAFQRDNSLITTGNFIGDTFKPDIDSIDMDVMEVLYLNRINYYKTRNEGKLVQRSTQNTRQIEASAMLEENNVHVLNTLKKQLEEACDGYLYQWNEPEARKGYTDAQMNIYRPWIGDMVQDLSIEFAANEWEQERMIMHCYVIVKFRDIIKRIILEININRPEYGGGGN